MSKTNQTKTAGQRCLPAFTSGDFMSVYAGDRSKTPPQKAASPSVKPHIWSDPDSVNGFLQIYGTFPRNAEKSGV
jgi:hypothetical protein